MWKVKWDHLNEDLKSSEGSTGTQVPQHMTAIAAALINPMIRRTHRNRLNRAAFWWMVICLDMLLTCWTLDPVSHCAHTLNSAAVKHPAKAAHSTTHDALISVLDKQTQHGWCRKSHRMSGQVKDKWTDEMLIWHFHCEAFMDTILCLLSFFVFLLNFLHESLPETCSFSYPQTHTVSSWVTSLIHANMKTIKLRCSWF